MSALELRAALSLAALFALRMLGLLVILPVFAIHARTGRALMWPWLAGCAASTG